MTIFVVLASKNGFSETSMAFHSEGEAESYIADQKTHGAVAWDYKIEKTMLVAAEPTDEQLGEYADELEERAAWEARLAPSRN